ncbi:hypothetical protein OSTOST_23949, partial [Ostertagia ostertagi]
MKLLEKGARTSGSRVLLPTNVPHMVQLHQFFETETFIILVLDYVECGMLWDFLIRYFSESERRFLLTLAASGAEVSCDVEAQQTKLDSMDCYRGRRLHFSVGVDFERVAEMRDETHSNDVPSVSGVCTMGEDATGASRAPEESASQTLLDCISNVRFYLRRERRRAWPGRRPLPEPLIVHWTAQIVSWLYVMHTEHGEAIGDLRPDNLLIDMDGNLQMTYYGKWHNNGKPKDIVEGYSAP